MAGSVAPIAAVAGSNSRKVPENATVHCQAGAGCAPVEAQQSSACRRHRQNQQQAPSGDNAARTTRTTAPARALRSMRGPNANAPSAQSSKERRHHGQHRGRFVAQPQRGLLRPHDLVAQPGKAGGQHQAMRDQPLKRMP